MTRFEDYKDKYPNIRMERRDGILQIAFHTEGTSLKWRPAVPGIEVDGGSPQQDLGYAFTDIGSDSENKVVIMTGTGDKFIAVSDTPRPLRKTAGDWDYIYWLTKRNTMALLDIEVPMISAINGPVENHTEVPVLCDIVLAAENATFRDATHFPAGVVPGDGVQIVWPLLLGLNRARYFLLTGQTLTAQRALELGVVNEVLPRQDLLPRAWELAEQLIQKPQLTLRYTRVAFTLYIKRLMQDMQGYTLALEGLAMIDMIQNDNKWASQWTDSKKTQE